MISAGNELVFESHHPHRKSWGLSQSALLLVSLFLLAEISGCKKPDKPVVETVDSPVQISPVFVQSSSIDKQNIVYENGEKSGTLSILESLGGGVGLFDYDQDGSLDLLFPGGGIIEKSKLDGLPSRLLRQISPETFEEISLPAGISEPFFYSHGVACGDFNNDGFIDALVTGYGGLVLWHNNGDGTFSNETIDTKLLDDQWSSSAAWGDFNNDGYLDLYVAHYVNWSLENNPKCRGPNGEPDVCPPRAFEGVQDSLYLNQGDGTFQESTQQAGLNKDGKGLGVLLIDLDQDRDLDIYVANDTVPNFFYVNDGQAHFEEQAMISGLALDDMANPNGSMGITATDYNLDGKTDLFVTNYEEELFGLYRNEGNRDFIYVSRRTGINQLGKLYVGFGCVAGDFDLDGDEDIAIANGHVVHHPVNAQVKQNPLYLCNNVEKKTFVALEFPTESYFSKPHLGRGMATGDVNRNGRLDLVFVNTLEPAALLLNQTQTKQKGVLLQLIGTRSNREGIGARVTLKTGKGEQVKDVSSGMSYLSSSPTELYFAIDHLKSIQEISVEWPSGHRSDISSAKIHLDQNATTWLIQIQEPQHPSSEPTEHETSITILPFP